MNVDVSAAGRERVDRLVIENRELEVPVRQVAVLRHALPDAVDVVLQRLVFVKAVRLDDLLVVAAGLFLLALLRADDDVRLAGDGIHCAANERKTSLRENEDGGEW